MRRLILLTLVSILVAPVAVGGDMTPEQAMQKMMNCVSCKPMMEYPQLGPNIRYDIFELSNGFVASFSMADEKLVPTLRECNKKCEVTRAEAMKLTPEEGKDKLCPFCTGMFGLMKRDDVKIEEFDTSMGNIVVATSTTDAGVQALHEYVAMATETSKLLDQAAAQMMEQGDPEGQKGH